MSSRPRQQVDLDRAIREAVIEVLESYRPREGFQKALLDELQDLRRSLTTLESRVERLARDLEGRRAGDSSRAGRPPLYTECSVPGCGRDHYARSLCSLHYQQWRRTKVWPAAAANEG